MNHTKVVIASEHLAAEQQERATSLQQELSFMRSTKINLAVLSSILPNEYFNLVCKELIMLEETEIDRLQFMIEQHAEKIQMFKRLERNR